MALMKPEHFVLTIGNAIPDPGASTSPFDTQLDAINSAEFNFEPVSKEINFKEPERQTNEVKLLGATSGNQNQELDPQTPTKGEFTGTLLLNPDDDNDFDFEQFKLTVHSQLATSYDVRYNYASATPSSGVAVVIVADAGSGKPIIQWLLNNAVIETLGGIQIDADGHATQEIRITAAADDCWKEWDLNGGS